MVELTVVDGSWKKKLEDDEQVSVLMCEYSKSGRAACGLCSDKIPKGEVRVGRPIKWGAGEFGYISTWHHLKCIRLHPGQENTDVNTQIWGMDTLAKNDQVALKAELKKTEAPTHIASIDPNDPDFAKSKILEPADQPKSVTLPLLPYQREGLGWMIAQEASDYRGGILADEMGMGKTLQAITTIVAGVEAAHKSGKKKAGSKKGAGSAKSGPTLVVAPSSAMLQWQDEIRRATKEDTLKVLVFYGGNRNKYTMNDLADADVVLTTFPVLEYEYRKIVDEHKIPCKHCGRRLLERSLVWHNKYFCGPTAMKTLKQAKQEKTTRKATTLKAMKTLKITKDGDSLPEGTGGTGERKKKQRVQTPMEIYKDLMASANRKALPMGAKASAADDNNNNNDEDDNDDDDDDGDSVDSYVSDSESKKPTKRAKTRTKQKTATTTTATATVTKTKAKAKAKAKATANTKADVDCEVDADADADGEVEVKKADTKSSPSKRKRTAKQSSTPLSTTTTGTPNIVTSTASSLTTTTTAATKATKTSVYVTAADNLRAKTVVQLKHELKSLGLPIHGTKPALIDRLMDANTASIEEDDKVVKKPKKNQAPSSPRRSRRSTRSKRDDDDDNNNDNDDDNNNDDDDDNDDDDQVRQSARTQQTSRTTSSSRPKRQTRASTVNAKAEDDADDDGDDDEDEDEAKPTMMEKDDDNVGNDDGDDGNDDDDHVNDDNDDDGDGNDGNVDKGDSRATPTRASTRVSTRTSTRASKRTTTTTTITAAAATTRTATTTPRNSKSKTKTTRAATATTTTPTPTTTTTTTTTTISPDPSPTRSLPPRSARKPLPTNLFDNNNDESDDEYQAGDSNDDDTEVTSDDDDDDDDSDFAPSSSQRRVSNSSNASRRNTHNTHNNGDAVDDDADDDGDDDDDDKTNDNGNNTHDDDDDDEVVDDDDDTTTPVVTKRTRARKALTKKAPPIARGAPKGKGTGKGKGKGKGDDSDDDDDYSKRKGASASKKSAKAKAEPTRFAKTGEFQDQEGLDLSRSILHCMPWHRVILDEAHKIKSRTNSTAKSCFALQAQIRWCLTGTPLQNRIGELFALIRFLQVHPFAFYFCNTKGCECKSMSWSFGFQQRHCLQCGCSKMKHFAYFNKNVINPVKRYGYMGLGRKAMLLLKDEVMDKIMLRRTKKERAEDVKIPPCDVSIKMLTFSEEEQDFYDCIYKQTRSRFDTFIDKGTLLHNYAHVFELLSRLRQAVDHPYLVVHGSYRGKNIDMPTKSKADNGGTDVCGICTLDILSTRDCAINSCRHTFHRDCILEYTNNDDDNENENDKDAKGKKKRKKSKTRSINSTAKMCPVCFLPLQITLDLRGMGDTDEDDDDDNTKTTTSPTTRSKKTTKTKGKTKTTQGTGAGDNDDNEADAEDKHTCVVCMENPRDALLLPCGHIYTCMTCVSQFRTRVCPICRTAIQKVIKADRSQVVTQNIMSPTSASSSSTTTTTTTTSRTPSGTIGRPNLLQKVAVEEFASSTKVDAVVAEIQKMRKQDKTNKAIVFSQYNKMLDLVDWKLRNTKMTAVKLVGSMSMPERRSVLKAFKTDPDVHVILMSLKAGGEGLNLQEASHVLVLEPWWNPQVEAQAIQRAHRIGQKRKVTAIRFITKGTIEERMLELQEKKQLIFDGAVDSNAGSLAQLTSDDLRFLFGGGS